MSVAIMVPLCSSAGWSRTSILLIILVSGLFSGTHPSAIAQATAPINRYNWAPADPVVPRARPIPDASEFGAFAPFSTLGSSKSSSMQKSEDRAESQMIEEGPIQPAYFQQALFPSEPTVSDRLATDVPGTVSIPEFSPGGTPLVTMSPEVDSDSIGEAPEDTSQLFLRQATVLLQPGEIQFDHGFDYSLVQTLRPVVLADNSIALERSRTRQFFVPLGLRFGTGEDVQGSISMPFGYSQRERSDPDSDDYNSAFGIGDVGVGLSWVLENETDTRPDVIATINLGIPTGDDPFGADPNDASLGLGFWTVTGSINAVKSYDPVVVFGSLGYQHAFERSFDGTDYQLGETFLYSMGMGFAISEQITVSSALVGAFQTDTYIDGARSTGSSFEPISLRLALTASTFENHIVEPFIRMGMSEDAGDAGFGVIITRVWSREEAN